jgi:hypothetical protein
MGRLYSLHLNDATMSATGIVVAIRPGAAFGLRVVRAWMAQRSSATSAQFGVQLGRKATAFPTLTNSFTPVKLDEGDGASQFTGGTALSAGTCGTVATSEGAGVFTPIIPDCFNNLSGWQFVATPDERFIFKAGSADACALRIVLSGSTGNISGGIIFEEV